MSQSSLTIISGRGLPWRPFLTAMALWLGACGCVTCALAQKQNASREYDLKAAFLYNFATFGEWPPSAFVHPNSPFIIGVLGADPFGRALEEIVAGERIKGRPIIIQRFDRLFGSESCHILFISASEKSRLAEVLAYYRERPVLTVSDIPGFVDAGGRVGFTTSTRIGLQVNQAALRAGNLAISPKLLRLADIVAVETPSP